MTCRGEDDTVRTDVNYDQPQPQLGLILRVAWKKHNSQAGGMFDQSEHFVSPRDGTPSEVESKAFARYQELRAAQKMLGPTDVKLSKGVITVNYWDLLP